MKHLTFSLLSYLLLHFVSCFNCDITFKNYKYSKLSKNKCQIEWQDTLNNDNVIFRQEFKKINFVNFDSIRNTSVYTMNNTLLITYSLIHGHHNGEMIFYYDNGTKSTSIPYRVDKIEGKYYEWYKNGNIKSVNYWVNGQMTGPDTQYYESGKIRICDNIINGKGYGPFVFYHENGQKGAESYVINNKTIGKGISWYSNGKVMQESFFNKDGLKDSIWMIYNNLGKAIKKYKYHNGDLLDSIIFKEKI